MIESFGERTFPIQYNSDHVLYLDDFILFSFKEDKCNRWWEKAEILIFYIYLFYSLETSIICYTKISSSEVRRCDRAVPGHNSCFTRYNEGRFSNVSQICIFNLKREILLGEVALVKILLPVWVTSLVTEKRNTVSV